MLMVVGRSLRNCGVGGKTLLFVILTAMTLLAVECAASGHGASAQPFEALVRVGTFNIRNQTCDKNTPSAWDERKDDLVALLSGMNLDAFGIQEAHPEAVAYVAEHMPNYSFVGEHRNADRKSGEATPVFWRKSRFEKERSGTFWLSETPEVPGLKGWGAACPRVCTWVRLKDRRNGKVLCFVNTHLDHKSALAGENGMHLILERMKDFAVGASVVLTGDHNCFETSKAATLATNVLKNALYLSERPPEGPWASYGGGGFARRCFVSCVEAMKVPACERNSKEGYRRFGGRIDYIYVSPDIQVLNYKTDASVRPGLDLYPSDHFPIVATLKIE